jgi:hypothetical protein
LRPREWERFRILRVISFKLLASERQGQLTSTPSIAEPLNNLSDVLGVDPHVKVSGENAHALKIFMIAYLARNLLTVIECDMIGYERQL